MLDLSTERIVLTGGAGFLGGHLQKALRDAGAADLLVPTLEQYDLTELPNVQRMYDDMQPTIVIHLAAQVGGIGANRDNPGRFFYANMIMGVHLIEQARLRALRKFVQLGTVCAYPKFTPVPFREEDLWNGYPEETNAPYGIAKKALLVMLQAYREQYGFNGIYLLPVNLYGPRDNVDPDSSHVIPALIRKFITARDRGDRQVTVWGTGSPSREFLYVEDAARAITLATQHYDGADPVNLGSGCEITISDLVDTIRRMVGYEGEVVWDSSKPDGQPRRCLNTSRAETLFGFRTKVDLNEGLRRTIEWAEAQKGLFDD